MLYLNLFGVGLYRPYLSQFVPVGCVSSSNYCYICLKADRLWYLCAKKNAWCGMYQWTPWTGTLFNSGAVLLVCILFVLCSGHFKLLLVLLSTLSSPFCVSHSAGIMCLWPHSLSISHTSSPSFSHSPSPFHSPHSTLQWHTYHSLLKWTQWTIM